MSEVTNVDKNEGHDNAISNTSEQSFDAKNRSDLDTAIKEVKKVFRSHYQQLLVKREELIIRLGKAFEAVISNPKSICKKIKNCLQEEIADKIISKRDIERYCPDKWKKRTKPKNDNLSFSKTSEQKPQQQIAATQGGKSVVINETSSNTDGTKQLHDQSKQYGMSVDNNEAQTTVTNQGELVSYNEPKDNAVLVADSASSDVVQKSQPHQEYSQNDQKEIKQLQRQVYELRQELVDKVCQISKLSDELRHLKELQTLQKDDASNDVDQKLKRTSMQAAEEIPVIEYPIPREKYGIVRDAMDNSKVSISVKFDRDKNFLGADPDVVFDISGANQQDRNVQQSDDVAFAETKEMMIARG